MKILSFDIGGTFIKWGIVDTKTYEIIENGKFPTDTEKNTGEKIIDLLVVKTQELVSELEIDGVGISMPGAIDSNKSIIVGATDNIPNSQGLNIQEIFNSKLPTIRVVVSNDVNVASLGELATGNLVGETNALMMTIGTGIGGAIIIDGKLYEGSSFLAGEIGRQFVLGKKWESIASTKALIEQMNVAGVKLTTGEEVFERLESDPLVNKVYTQWLEYVSEGISNLIAILNPKTIVIGGGITEETKFCVEHIKEKLNNYLPIEFVNSITLRKAKLGNKAAIIGASKFWEMTNKNIKKRAMLS